MSTERYRLFPLATFAVALAGLVACGESQATHEPDAGPVDLTPRSVGIDHFGCPMVDPTPWGLELEDYETFCGAGCFPAAADLVDAPAPERWFIACVSEDASSGGVGQDALGCARSPIDGRAYYIYLSALLPLMDLCWYFCTDDGPNPDPAYGFPDYCFE